MSEDINKETNKPQKEKQTHKQSTERETTESKREVLSEDITPPFKGQTTTDWISSAGNRPFPRLL